MASTISDDMIFSLLKKVPSNSFVVKWKRVRPNMQIPAAGIQLVGPAQQGKQSIQLQLQGGINEMALLSRARVAISVKAQDSKNITANSVFQNPDHSPFNPTSPFNKASFKYAGANIVVSSEESYNAGSLKLYDNTNADSFAPVNVFRGLMSRRNAKFDIKDINANYDDIKLQSLSIADLEDAGFSSTAKRADGVGVTYADFGGGPFTLSVNSYANATQNSVAGAIVLNPRDQPSDTAKVFKFPLSMFSSLASTYSVLPIGLFSSFSVNGYTINLTIDGTNSVTYPTYDTTISNVAMTEAAGTKTVTLHDIVIYYPSLTILNVQVMQSILSLYRKESSISVGNIEVPTSLRMNCINYNISTFNVATGINQFTIPSTSKSARALGWIIYDRSNRTETVLTQNNNTTGRGAGSLRYPLSVRGCTVRGLELKIGSQDISGHVINQSPQQCDVEEFIHENVKQAGGVFSLFPYWCELPRPEVGAEDLLNAIRSRSTNGPSGQNVISSMNWQTRDNHSVQYGCISLQNMQYSSPDSGVVASGVSLNNIGRYDLTMEFKAVTQDGAGINAYTDVLNPTTLAIAFIEAYDEVVETSAASGVSIITNAVLA